jgi:hypothetical protein
MRVIAHVLTLKDPTKNPSTCVGSATIVEAISNSTYQWQINSGLHIICMANRIVATNVTASNNGDSIE